MIEKPTRVQAIQHELDTDADNYTHAKSSFDISRVHFEAARDRLAGTKRLASEILDPYEWYTWREEHPHVKYAGTVIGEAILDVLVDYAYGKAFDFLDSTSPTYDPSLTLEEITEALESGGFDFRSSTPAREVNAALIHLTGKVKSARGYATADAEAIMESAREYALETEDQVIIKGTDQEGLIA